MMGKTLETPTLMGFTNNNIGNHRNLLKSCSLNGIFSCWQHVEIAPSAATNNLVVTVCPLVSSIVLTIHHVQRSNRLTASSVLLLILISADRSDQHPPTRLHSQEHQRRVCCLMSSIPAWPRSDTPDNYLLRSGLQRGDRLPQLQESGSALYLRQSDRTESRSRMSLMINLIRLHYRNEPESLDLSGSEQGLRLPPPLHHQQLQHHAEP